ncbi:MAG: bifunctional folylpolyglutamate synthase/dihydrofolate synthase [Chloroflexi bacterium]|nr:bifunctional folylpolyglutamate synthase/dihydrofolate synthase [Chloroflexota bacterium]
MPLQTFPEELDGKAACEADALAWLYSFADQERGVGWNPEASVEAQWKLGRTRLLLDLLGSPDLGMPTVLVAGTKGKGSTAAMLARLLAAAGLRLGLATKPHLQVYRERIRVDGQMLSPADFARGVRRLKAVVERLRARHPEAGEPTTFELTTALALAAFRRARCAVAVIEVGLGGRLDATNAMDPVVSVITTISHDHTAILGRTLPLIAAEKAGIFRRGRPAVIAPQRPAARTAITASARALATPLTWARAEPHLCPPLQGEHQRTNAAVAWSAALAVMRVLGKDATSIDTPGRATAVLADLRWPGRFECVTTGAQRTLILDGAHNDGSAAALAAALGEHGLRELYLVIGINRDKDAAAVLRPILPLTARAWATRAASSARALAPEVLAARVRRRGTPISVAENVAEALDQALTHRPPRPVLVTGSLALVGEARTLLRLPPPEPLWGAEGE